MFCTKCGTQNNNGERFCKNCGVILENAQTPQQPNNINNGNQQYSNMYICKFKASILYMNIHVTLRN